TAASHLCTLSLHDALPISAARLRKMFYLDATCPLVSKVHVEAERHHATGRAILLIGHAGHPEVIGTMGQLPDGAVRLIETAADRSEEHTSELQSHENLVCR